MLGITFNTDLYFLYLLRLSWSRAISSSFWDSSAQVLQCALTLAMRLQSGQLTPVVSRSI